MARVHDREKNEIETRQKRCCLIKIIKKVRIPSSASIERYKVMAFMPHYYTALNESLSVFGAKSLKHSIGRSQPASMSSNID